MWLWTALPFVVGMVSFQNFNVIAWIELVLFTFPLNFLLYGINDAYDYKSDRMNNRKDGKLQGTVPTDKEIERIKKLAWVPAVTFILVSLFTLNPQHILFSLVWVVLCFTYSHSFFRFKDKIVLDTLNSALIYTLPGLVAFTLHSSLSEFPTILLFIVSPFMGIHAVTTLLDYDVDKKAGMTTIGVVWGHKRTIIYSLFLYVVALLFLWKLTMLASVLLVSIFLHVSALFADHRRNPELLFGFSASLVVLGMTTMVYYVLVFNGL